MVAAIDERLSPGAGGVVTDAAGNIYLSGSFYSSTRFGAFTLSAVGYSDGYRQ
jgi:hypothetical protein